MNRSMNRLKRIITVLLVASLMVFGVASAFAEVIYVDPDTGEILTPTEPPGTPNIHLIEPTLITQAAGTTETYELLLRNIGNGDAKSGIITQAADAEFPGTLSFPDGNNSFFSIVRGSSKRVNITVDIPTNAKAGNYNVTFNYIYTDRLNAEVKSSDTLVIKVENDYSSPNLILTGMQTSLADIGKGTAFSITGTIQNTSIIEARGIQLSASGFATDTVTLNNTSNNIYLTTLAGEAQSAFKFDLITSDDVKTGSYPLTFGLKYKDKEGNDFEGEYTYFVNVNSVASDDAKDKAVLVIQNMTAPTGSTEVGQEFSVSFDLVNTGAMEAKDIKITAAAADSASVVPRSANIQQKNTMAVGETAPFTFIFSPNSDAKTQNYSVGFTVEYDNGADIDDAAERQESFMQYTGVDVTNPDEDEDETSVPKIIISQYTTDPIIVQAGSEFDLHMTFQNTHASTTVRNIEASLTVVEESEDKGYVFTPVNDSNSFYISSIAPGQEISKSLHMYAVPDALPKSYQINVKLVYEDENAKEFTSDKVIGINVKQTMKLETSEFFVPEFANVGEPVYVSFQLYNTGKVKLNNVMVKVVGDGFDTTGAEYYIGAFDIGSSDYYDASFTPTQAGTLSGQVVISYEDDMGETITQPKDFTMDVQEMQMMDPNMDLPEGMNDMPAEDAAGGFAQQYGAWIFLGVVIAVVAIVVVRRRIVKKRREQELDE